MLKPLHDNVLIELIEAEGKTKSGIILPDSAKERPKEGRVVAVGPGKKTKTGDFIPLDIKVDDIVVYKGYSGTEVTIDEKEHILISEENIIAIKE